MRFYHLQVVLVSLSLLSEPLSEVLGLFSELEDCVVPVVLSVLLDLRKLVLQCSLLNEQQLSFVMHLLLALLDSMFVLEKVFGNLVRLVVSFLVPLRERIN